MVVCLILFYTYEVKQKVKIIFLSIFFIAVSILLTRTLFTLSHTITPDFQVYYSATKNFLNNTSIYKQNVFTLFTYPPISTFIFILFIIFPYFLAQNIFLSFSFFALLSISIFIPIILNNKFSFIFSAFILAFSYLSFPTKFTLGMGQVNLIAYALLIVSLLFYSRQKNLWAALFFVLSCIAKPILGFLILFFILKKQWKIIAYTFFIFSFLFLISIVIDKHALQDYLYYIQKVIPEASNYNGRGVYYNQGFMGFVFRTLPINSLQTIISFLGIAAVFVLGLITIIKTKKNDLYQLSVLLTMLPILDTLSWQHHFVVLILPFTYVFMVLYKQKNYWRLGLVFIAYILVSINIKTPGDYTNFPFNILLSHTFYGTLLLLIILLQPNNFEKYHR